MTAVYGTVGPNKRTVMSILAVHRIIEEQASTHKDRPAIVDANLTLSYHELNREANGLARHLFAHGFGRGALLAVPLRPTLDTAILLLAVLKTGGSYSLLAEDGNLCAWRAVPGAVLEREPMALPDLASAPKSAS